jgi:hypothetical protein
MTYEKHDIPFSYLLLFLDLFDQDILLLVQLTVNVSLHSLLLLLHPLLSLPELFDLVS